MSREHEMVEEARDIAERAAKVVRMGITWFLGSLLVFAIASFMLVMVSVMCGHAYAATVPPQDISLSGHLAGEKACCETVKIFIEHEEPVYSILFAMASESHGYWVTKEYCHDIDVPEVPVPAAVWLFLSGLFGFIGIGRVT